MTPVVRWFTVVLTVAVASATWSLGGAGAVAYLFLFALVTIPGLPLGFLLFGRRHAAGWVAGMLLGYGITALGIWVVRFWAHPSLPAFVVAWGGLSAVTWLTVLRGTRGLDNPLVDLPPWGAADTSALLLVLLLVPALVGRPFARVGSSDRQGNRLYRAYFTADFVWHTALVAEMTKGTQPPRNPYLASQPVHYYWAYFLVPASISGETPIGDVEMGLKVNALCTALLFVAAIYLAAWSAAPAHGFAVAVALLLTTVAASAEGWKAITDLLRRGRSLGDLRELNIDAITAWAFGGLRIDNLPRSMWYTPQHSMAFALGLISVPVAVTSGVRAHPGAIALTGLALALSVTVNPLVGAMLSAVYGAAVIGDAIRTRAHVRDVFNHALAALPVIAAVGWCTLNQVAEGAGQQLRFGLLGPARQQPIGTFLLSFGPILIPAGIGLLTVRTVPFSRVWPAFAGVILAVLIMHSVTLEVDLFWVGFRTGQLFFVLVPALMARGLIKLWEAGLRRVAIAVVLIVLAAGLPTTVIDAYNAQDVDNRRMGPGFHWTVVLTPAEQEGLAWIRTHTPTDAIVQAEPTVRGRETWSLIPSFAERRMAGGLPISLMHVPAYDTKSAQVRQIYASDDAALAWQIAKQLGIDYLYVDATERLAYPGISKFDAHAEYFPAAFRNAEVTVYAVK